MIAEKDILAKTKDFTFETLSKKVPTELQYHNLEHTKKVVRMAIEIGSNSGLSKREMEVLEIAAWFHDTGYSAGGINHEEESVRIASEFLHNEGVDLDFLEGVIGCIKATRMPQSPKNLLEEILCDADLYNLSSDHYFDEVKGLRKEWEDDRGKKYSDAEWLKINIEFFENHTYFTDYARKTFREGFERNFRMIKQQFKEIRKTDDYLKQIEKENAKLKAKVEKDIKKRPDRGIETMFRITSKNHLQLSAMADNKANIMISINTILLSVIVTVLIRKLEQYPHFVIPTIILTSVCLATIVFSVLATRPNVSRGKFTRTDIINKKTNLLFFGNFHGMKLNDYLWGMKEMMKDGEYLYGSLIKDIYYLGIVLGKKYRMLRIGYTIFMFGLVISVISFLVSEFIVRAGFLF